MSHAHTFGKGTRAETVAEGLPTEGRGYPLHLEPGNLYFHRWKGRVMVGRVTSCLVCNVTSETRNRNGDARFIRAHRRCGFKR